MNINQDDVDAIRAALAADPVLLAEVIGAVRRSIVADVEKSRLEPGVVTAVQNRPNGFPGISVLIDGDSVDNVTPVNPLSFKHPSDLAVGERVLTLFDPPNAPYYIGSITDRGLVGYGKPYSTRVIAAVDSIATNARNADYVCDGVDDEEEINAAVDDLIAGGVGGRVLLLEGSYSVASTISVPDGVVVAGLGRDTMTITYDGDGVLFDFTGGAIEDLRTHITGSGKNWEMTGSDAGYVRRCWFTTQGGV